MTEVTVGQLTYTLRKFQSGPGHDWLRKTPGPHEHRSANAEVNALVDEIVRLRALVESERIGGWSEPPPEARRPTTAAGVAADLIKAVDKSMGVTVSTERPKPGQPLPAQVHKAKETAPGACAAITRKSQRCKVPADPDSEFCHLHRPDGAYQRNMMKRWEENGPPSKKEAWWKSQK